MKIKSILGPSIVNGIKRFKMAERTEFNKFKNLAQNTLLYTISNFGSKIFTFF